MIGVASNALLFWKPAPRQERSSELSSQSLATTHLLIHLWEGVCLALYSLCQRTDTLCPSDKQPRFKNHPGLWPGQNPVAKWTLFLGLRALGTAMTCSDVSLVGPAIEYTGFSTHRDVMKLIEWDHLVLGYRDNWDSFNSLKNIRNNIFLSFCCCDK